MEWQPFLKTCMVTGGIFLSIQTVTISRKKIHNLSIQPVATLRLRFSFAINKDNN